MFRATVRSLLSRKARLLLSGFAVVLGVMAVSGALIVTDTVEKSFESLFQTANAQIDVQVTGQQNVRLDGPGGAATEPVHRSTVNDVARVPGVAQATGAVMTPAVRVIGPDGKVLVNQGPPTFGVDWPGLSALENLASLRQGRAPSGPDEVALSANLAERAGVTVGDPVDLLTLQPRHTYTVVGVFGYSGGRETIFGESRVAFDTATAQRELVGQPAHFHMINVAADAGVTPEELKRKVAAALGDDFTVRTGDEIADAQAAATGEWVNMIRQVLLGFAAVALVVGIFLILNTFSILVSQRSGELAVLRSLGANRLQIIGSVLIEAAAVGVLASTIGLGAGFGLAALLKMTMESFSGATLPIDGLTVPPLAVIAAYLVGVLVTVFAALLPAARASRVPPVAALRQSAVEQRPLWPLSVTGGTLLLGGTAALWLTTTRDTPAWLLAAGVLGSFVGAALSIPMISRPAVSLLGRAVSWSTPGELGRRNSARNPRRTAITAAALMVGVSLVTGAGVVAHSLQASITTLVESDLDADLVITSGAATATGPPPIGGYDPTVLDAARDLPGVSAAAALHTDTGQLADDQVELASGNLPSLAPFFRLSVTASAQRASGGGTPRTLNPGEVALSKEFAADHDLAVGDTLRLATSKGGRHSYTVAMVHTASSLLPPALLSPDDADVRFRATQPTSGYLKLTDDADPADVRRDVAALLKDNPDYTVADQSDYAVQQASQVDTFLTMLYILTGLAMAIAALGVVNTLVLSVVERTRELGMLRAIGLQRAQLTWMVTAESVVIAVFGAALGVAVGAGLGVGVSRALRDSGLEQLALPWSSMGVLLLGAVVIGLVAAALPAIRAARANMLSAIAYE